MNRLCTFLLAALLVAASPLAGQTAAPGDPHAIAARVRAQILSGHPSAAERLAAQALEQWPDDVDLLVARAKALRALNRKPEAKELIARAVELDPRNDEALRMRRLLQQELQSSEVSLDTNYDNFSDHRDPWVETQLAARRNTTFGPAIARVSHVNRFDKSDDLVEVEGYPRFRSTYGYFGFGYSTNAVLYPKTRYAAEIYQGVSSGFEGSIGLRRLNFNGPINIYTGSLSKYHREWLFSLRGYHTAGVQGSNAFQLMARHYFADGTQYVGLRVGKGSSRDEIRSANDLEALEVRDVTAEGLFELHQQWLLNVRAGYGKDPSTNVKRGSLTLGIGYRF
jgi:YaiO family outer membrane protein